MDICTYRNEMRNQKANRTLVSTKYISDAHILLLLIIVVKKVFDGQQVFLIKMEISYATFLCQP